MQVENMIEPMLWEDVCGVLESRSEFYLMLAGLYFKPLTQAQIDGMAEEDYAGYVVGESLLDEGFDDIRRALRKRHTGTRSILATEWTSTFGGAEAYKGRYCVPNASVFLDESGLTYGRPRTEVSRIYGEQCLRLADNSGMPESHISFELEFLSILSGEISRHLRAGEFDRAL
ncbi:MAG: molecular chaperone TorD family protein, partial [Gordonibacter sp.]